MSGVSPFGYGETILTGLDGKVCASAPVAAASRSAPASLLMGLRRIGRVHTHVDHVALVEEVVDRARLVLDLPPVVVEVLEVEAVGAVAREHLVDLLDAILVLQA